MPNLYDIKQLKAANQQYWLRSHLRWTWMGLPWRRGSAGFNPITASVLGTVKRFVRSLIQQLLG
ncbi:MAG: hypothetical protein RIC38_12075, partial [Chromatocurvus sp.]